MHVLPVDVLHLYVSIPVSSLLELRKQITQIRDCKDSSNVKRYLLTAVAINSSLYFSTPDGAGVVADMVIGWCYSIL